ncbi:hypothetical protein NDU88_003302 [Pleurodeles waltl]|uniref:Uncharacterized protein n=1 Tax=Pleurodeles waltl TaxID=8319 RepID=A0AAV7LIG3_PLEWA|nr:hypothetical protein NDU88_003302 [Pleurodeles waltl]
MEGSDSRCIMQQQTRWPSMKSCDASSCIVIRKASGVAKTCAAMYQWRGQDALYAASVGVGLGQHQRSSQGLRGLALICDGIEDVLHQWRTELRCVEMSGDASEAK